MQILNPSWKCIWKLSESWVVKMIMKKKNKIRRLMLLYFKIYFKTAVIKTVWIKMAVYEFCIYSSQIKSILTTTHKWECVCGSPGGTQWRNTSTALEQNKNQKWYSLKMLRGTDSHYLCYLSHKAVQCSAKKDFLGPCFPPQEKVREWDKCLSSSAMKKVVKEAYFFLTPSRILIQKLDEWGAVSSRKNSCQSSEWKE